MKSELIFAPAPSRWRSHVTFAPMWATLAANPNLGDGKNSPFQWIGLRENSQETIDFPIKYGVFRLTFSHHPIH